MKLSHYLLREVPVKEVDGYLVCIQRNGDVVHIGPSTMRSHDYVCENFEPAGLKTTERISFNFRMLYGFNAHDLEMVKKVAAMFSPSEQTFEIKDVIFNDPVVVVKWADGTKTVAKAKDEPYDPEKGLAMCFAKKALGNTFRSFTPFKRALKKAPKPKTDIIDADSKPKRARKGGAK